MWSTTICMQYTSLTRGASFLDWGDKRLVKALLMFLSLNVGVGVGWDCGVGLGLRYGWWRPGLRIAPPEAPVTGYMFGKGVYFADMVSKSANYCCTRPGGSDAVLLLAEVALGDMRELTDADYNANKLPPGKLSTKGLGKVAPDPKDAIKLPDGTVVPLGKGKDTNVDKGYLCYNEYIVYNVDQIRMRYVLRVKFQN
ncbi:hypothetical protein CBR_g57225 [Chara braunii]|uniref:Poly [ADP-ribose] polymerase n=1 Tax=Chara braunii TaxID=69332 RepID=A0A388ME13_CHABU|nr:hypothetical protein CBR_g57225 [Chara braunii]|eukprot:GBG92800.1 hypothetical protein CBR_g57225 [Chara braunii]